MILKVLQSKESRVQFRWYVCESGGLVEVIENAKRANLPYMGAEFGVYKGFVGFLRGG